MNAHLCRNLHVIDSPACQCGATAETVKHYFFECPLYTNQRDSLFENLGRRSLSQLLFGDFNLNCEENKHVFLSVHKFICDSGRFD